MYVRLYLSYHSSGIFIPKLVEKLYTVFFLGGEDNTCSNSCFRTSRVCEQGLGRDGWTHQTDYRPVKWARFLGVRGRRSYSAETSPIYRSI